MFGGLVALTARWHARSTISQSRRPDRPVRLKVSRHFRRRLSKERPISSRSAACPVALIATPSSIRLRISSPSSVETKPDGRYPHVASEMRSNLSLSFALRSSRSAFALAFPDPVVPGGMQVTASELQRSRRLRAKRIRILTARQRCRSALRSLPLLISTHSANAGSPAGTCHVSDCAYAPLPRAAAATSPQAVPVVLMQVLLRLVRPTPCGSAAKLRSSPRFVSFNSLLGGLVAPQHRAEELTAPDASAYVVAVVPKVEQHSCLAPTRD